MYYWAQYILAQKQIYQIVLWFVWERGKSRQRILKVLVPLSTVIQGGTMGGWGPDAEAKTAESFGTTFNLRRVIAILGLPPWLETPPGVLIPCHRRHRANWHIHTLDISYLLVLWIRNLEASSSVDRVAQPQCDDEEWDEDQWRLPPN